MLEAVNEKGTFDEEEVEMIQNVFAFDDTSVEEVCTHRVDVVMLDLDDDMTVWEETIQNSRFTYYPISGEDDDDIIGVLDTKDFFRLADRSRESVMANAVFCAGKCESRCAFGEYEAGTEILRYLAG